MLVIIAIVEALIMLAILYFAVTLLLPILIVILVFVLAALIIVFIPEPYNFMAFCAYLLCVLLIVRRFVSKK